MEASKWHRFYNYAVIAITAVLAVVFFLPESGYHYGFGIGALVILALFVINLFTKIPLTLIFIIMIGSVLAGLLNWPLKEGVKVKDLDAFVPAMIPFIGFVVLALLYWENRNRF